MLKTELVRSDLQVAISGSGGLIGSALCRELVNLGHPVRYLVRTSGSDKDAKPVGANDIGWSPERGLLDPSQINGVSCVVHLAGHSVASGRWTSSEKARIRSSRVAATRRLVDQICQLDRLPAVFISASAVGIYGDQDLQIVDERTPAAGGFLADVAREWEEACEPLARLGVRVIHPRFGIVLSAQGGALAKMLPIFHWYLGGRIGSGQQYWSWISLHDCVRALLWLISNSNANGAYNLVSPQPVTNAEFTQSLAHALHVPALVPVPAWALRVIAGEMADALLLCSCRVVPSRLIEQGFTFERPELSSCLRAEFSS